MEKQRNLNNFLDYLMKDIYITWEDYHNKIEQLAKKIHEDKLKFNQIICIAKVD